MTGKKNSLAVPLNFLLGRSEGERGNFQLARLNETANLRSELHAILDRTIDQMSQAALAAWFRGIDRQTPRQPLERDGTEEILSWAKAKIRDEQRSGEDLIPVPSLTPEDVRAHHSASAQRYQQRNIAGGKCSVCPQPPESEQRPAVRKAPGSKARAPERRVKETNKPPHGRAPGTVAALAEAREKRKKQKEIEG
jgi:hypothetical protein